MTQHPEDRLQVLEDREAIRELQATYCFLVDDGRFDELVDHHFGKDARCDFHLMRSEVEPMVAEGHEPIRFLFTQAAAATSIATGGKATPGSSQSEGRRSGTCPRSERAGTDGDSCGL